MSRTALALVAAAGLAATTLLSSANAAQEPIGSAFTFSGVLADGQTGEALDGLYDVTVRLWSEEVAGGLVAQTVFTDLAIDDGAFSVELDFGTLSATSYRWLEIEVNGEVLAPRLAIEPAPIARALPGLRTTGQSVPSLLGGYFGNFVDDVALGSVLAGGGLGAGNQSSIYDAFGVIVGGTRNAVGTDNGNPDDASHSLVVGGFTNNSAAQYGAIGGGRFNLVTGQDTFLGGGFDNTVNGAFGTSGGGETNVVNGTHAGVLGGESNVAGGALSFVGGGQANAASGFVTVIGGGGSNLASGDYATVVGGLTNQATGDYAIAAGGQLNRAEGTESTAAGGYSNSALANWSSALGGRLNIVTGASATIAGGRENIATSQHASVLGGGLNIASGPYSSVVGGLTNEATSSYSHVGGGQLNRSTGIESTVGGGYSNEASDNWATVAGGRLGVASGSYAAIGGGVENRAEGPYSTVPGGFACWATGQGSFASGTSARAEHDGCFVWNDDSGTVLSSSGPNQFRARAVGGVSFWTSAAGGALLPGGSGSWSTFSDRNAKHHLEAIDPEAILDRVIELRLSSWSYKEEGDVRHLGPMAQDFHAAFGLGPGDRYISTVDADGVALAAIQGLHRRLEARDRAMADLRTENDHLHAELERLEVRLDELVDLLR